MTQATEQRILCPVCRATNRGDARFCQQCGSDVLLDNIYRLTRFLKEGGMARVYKAIDAAGHEYAIKEMQDHFTSPAEREEGIMRFIDEVKMVSTLNHPAIPQVYRSFIDEGHYYLSMEFIYGEDLEDMLKREKRFAEPVVMRWAEQLCDVLEYVHSAGLIYSDMKPANVMIDRDGNVKLVDFFGIARRVEPGKRNAVTGTPGYAPPEQYQGFATVESDIYALGATLHHLLTGRDPREHPPFTFPLATTLNRAVSVQTARALDKALAMEVADRFRSVEAFRRALPIVTGDRRPTLPFDPPGRPQQPDRRRPTAPQPAAPRQAAPQPARPQRRRSRLGRAIRRAAVATVLGAGLAGAGVALYPEVVPAVRDLVTNLAQGGAAPAVTWVTESFKAPVKATLPEGASEGQISEALREEYIRAAQARYPGARLNSTSRPAAIGGWQAGEVVNGMRTYTAEMSGAIDIPQSP